MRPGLPVALLILAGVAGAEGLPSIDGVAPMALAPGDQAGVEASTAALSGNGWTMTVGLGERNMAFALFLFAGGRYRAIYPAEGTPLQDETGIWAIVEDRGRDGLTLVLSGLALHADGQAAYAQKQPRTLTLVQSGEAEYTGSLFEGGAAMPVTLVKR